jgi:LPXTG-site transpeptidase (sortase) family protein
MEKILNLQNFSRQGILLIIAVAALLFFLLAGTRNVNAETTGQTDPGSKDSTALINKAIASSSVEKTNFGLPVRLIIPEISVDAPLVDVGLTAGGAMDMTKSLVNVDWFNLRARPGNTGNAVIGGHFNGGRGGKISVFDNLHKLLPGDQIFIEDDQGLIIPFIVREIRNYDYNANAPEVFDSSDGKAHLNLVTCEGVWNEVTKNYSQRRVVFADKE